VENQLVGTGSVAPFVNLGTGSHTLSFSNSDTFNMRFNLSASFNASRVQQEVYGRSVSEDRYSAILNYHFQKPLWGTVLVYAGVNDQAANGENQGASLNAGANFSRKIKQWQLGGSFAYQQAVETVVSFVTTSSYSFNANVSRDLTRRMRWFTSFNEFHSGLGQVAGSSNKTEGVQTSVLYRAFAVAANYSENIGTALITQNGLVAAPVSIPTVLLPANEFLQTSGTAYSVSASGTARKLILTGAYTKASESTSSPSANTSGNSTVLFANAAYPWRKMGFTAGYTHVSQGVGVPGQPQSTFSSYYIGISRWFKPF
jgi:hypothetical protein